MSGGVFELTAGSRVHRYAEMFVRVASVVLLVIVGTNATAALDLYGTPTYELALLVILGGIIGRGGVRTLASQLPPRAVGATYLLLATYGLVRIVGGRLSGVDLPTAAFADSWLKYMLVVVALILATTDRRQAHLLAGTVVATIAVLAGPSLFQHLTGTYSFEWFGLAQVDRGFIERVERVQIGGPFGNPNPLVMWLITALPIAASYALGTQRAVVQRSSFLLGAIAVVTVIATQSRQGLIALVVVGVLIARYIGRPSARTALKLGAAMAVVVLVVFASNPTRWVRQVERIGEVTAVVGGDIDPNTSSAGYAGTFWAGLDMFADNPVIGVGHGNFAELYPEYVTRRAIDQSGKSRAAHNMVVHLLAETGLVGFVLLSAGGVALVRALRGARTTFRGLGLDAEADLATALLVAYSAWLVVGLFQGLYHSEQFIALVGLGLGLATLAGREEKQARFRREASTGT